MKFSHINIHNLRELVPSWAIDYMSLARHLDGLFSTPEGQKLSPVGDRVYQKLPFWIEVDCFTSSPFVRVCTPDDEVDVCGHLIIKCASVAHERCQIELPLNSIFKGYVNIAGTYLVYTHSLRTETPLTYVGMTKQRWFERYSQHLSSAKSGSHLLFHRALREHTSVDVLHKIFMCELSHDNALEMEEELVGVFGLYPLGLNMIPGGRAGFKYLSSLGLQAKSAEDRDEILERISARESIDGRPNPLCSARWANDDDYAERVICGHSGRLTAEQVRMIRLGASFGKSHEVLATEVSAKNVRQVQNLLAGRTYSRIKSNK